jgi:colanic acid/amylovoran biosynthesis glycosyltransferase
VVQEVQACCLPVVVTLHNGVRDGMLEGTTGQIVEEKDHHAMAQKLAMLAENPGLRMQMGDAARRFVLQKYCSVALAKQLEGILADVIGTK